MVAVPAPLHILTGKDSEFGRLGQVIPYLGDHGVRLLSMIENDGRIIFTHEVADRRRRVAPSTSP